MYLSVAVAGNKYCIFGWVQGNQGAIEDCLLGLYVENLPRWGAKFGKLARRIWKNLPRKTVIPGGNQN